MTTAREISPIDEWKQEVFNSRYELKRLEKKMNKDHSVETAQAAFQAQRNLDELLANPPL